MTSESDNSYLALHRKISNYLLPEPKRLGKIDKWSNSEWSNDDDKSLDQIPKRKQKTTIKQKRKQKLARHQSGSDSDSN